MPAPQQDSGEIRLLVPGHLDDAGLVRFQVHEPDQAAEVQQGGDQVRGRDRQVGHAGVGGDDERRGAHDRRHDLPSVGRQRFDGAGNAGPIAQPHHHRYRELTGGIDIGDRRSGDRADHCRGHDRDLRRPALGVTGNRVGEIDEEAGDARLLRERAEDDEQHDVGRGDPERDAPDSVVRHVQVVEHVLERVRPVAEHENRYVLAEVGIEQRHGDDDHEHPSEDSPRRFQDQQRGDHRACHLDVAHGERRRHRPSIRQVLAVVRHVADHRDCEQRESPVVERDLPVRLAALASAYREEGDDQRQHDRNRALYVRIEGAEISGIDVKRRQTDCDDTNEVGAESGHRRSALPARRLTAGPCGRQRGLRDGCSAHAAQGMWPISL